MEKELGPISEPNQSVHEYDMENTDGYKLLIEKGLTPGEASRFISIAIVESMAPQNLSERDGKELDELRKKMQEKSPDTN